MNKKSNYNYPHRYVTSSCYNFSMRINKWPYWLRGGIIGTIIGLILLGGYQSCVFIVTPHAWPLKCLLWLIPMWPVYLPYLGTYNTTHLPETIIALLGIIEVFVLGSLIGAIVGLIIKKARR